MLNSSGHGKFSIEDDDDENDNVEISFESDTAATAAISEQNRGHNLSHGYRTIHYTGDKGNFWDAVDWTTDLWSTLTFSWMEQLLKTGNEKPLEMADLGKLAYQDSAEGVYKKFKHGWVEQLHSTDSPSLTMAFFHAFGTPFLTAAFLKLVHDSALFVGPQLLNALINFLNDPSQPMETGLWYVFGFFVTNLVMSLCLRQYFW